MCLLRHCEFAEKLRYFLNQFKINVYGIYLSKACLSDHNLSCCNLSGYCLFYCNLNTKAFGSAIYVFDEVKTKQMSIKIVTDGCEDVWVKLTSNQQKSVIVRSVYTHPSYSIKPFKNALLNIIKKFSAN